MDVIAHRREDGLDQSLLDHLRGTALLAERFAAPFGGAAEAYRAGLLHDIGKYAAHFQRRIRDPEHVLPHDHATAGAQAVGVSPVAFAIAGHHGGLPDGGNPVDSATEPSLHGRMKRDLDDYSAWRGEVVLPTGSPPPFLQKADAFSWAFYTRMLFSALVDADFIDTETFMQGTQPRGAYDSIPSLLARLEAHFESFGAADTPLNATREKIAACCRTVAAEDMGAYTLTVPTGGGKTLSSLRFALHHAKMNGLERVIYVIPYTSIIDQTAEVFSSILGEEQVLEHHSSVSFEDDSQDSVSVAAYRKKLATENWDAPIIVTTAVQFFESLYADRPSRCRKLHHIANSVVIFDEAQTFPVPHLLPAVAAIAELVKHYRVTAVLCTATQPELAPMFQKRGVTLREIMPEPALLYQTLQRATVQGLGSLSWADLGERLAGEPQMLCVVGRRKSAQTLFRMLPEEGSYCLSTLLYPKHRKTLLQEIRARLREGLPCRVVSTSLIEAGVDLDFPTVYREKAGLDSILQAAGRCNREGKRSAAESVVWYFESEEGATLPTRQAVSVLDAITEYHADITTPEAIRSYFELLWQIKDSKSLDVESILPAIEKGIIGCFCPFRQIAGKFHLINSHAKTVYVPIGEGVALANTLRQGIFSRNLFRKLGQYGVTVYPDHMEALVRAGAVICLESGDGILSEVSRYHPQTGLTLDIETGIGHFT